MCIMINTKANDHILNSAPEGVQTKITSVTIFFKRIEGTKNCESCSGFLLLLVNSAALKGS